jgi:hypothetical protein
MNPLIVAFKTCAHQAGAVCNFSTGKLAREFGLPDFLENAIQEGDDRHHAARKEQVPQQALRDLVGLLKSSPLEDQIRAWIHSHF